MKIFISMQEMEQIYISDDHWLLRRYLLSTMAVLINKNFWVALLIIIIIIADQSEIFTQNDIYFIFDPFPPLFFTRINRKCLATSTSVRYWIENWNCLFKKSSTDFTLNRRISVLTTWTLWVNANYIKKLLHLKNTSSKTVCLYR